jgi:3-hydroxymyristoyl/3-hydroxydecanoyl-(acyl carrier protein) dehydratase
MSERFRAFTFVERISGLEPGVRARGSFAVPGGIPRFPATLVAEAVGQLAAWTAMAHIDFRGRPVAALAGESRFLGSVSPGQTIDLAIEIESCSDEAVAYHGWAEVAGARVLELERCLGPMLPLEDFDSAEALRAHFERLCGPGAGAGGFAGVPEPDLRIVDEHAGRSFGGRLQVPAAAPFFGDHFPRRPVFPATLLLDAQTALAANLVAGLGAPGGGGRYTLSRVSDVKVRAFTAPGQVLELAAEVADAGQERVMVALTAFGSDGKRVASARAEFAAGGAA